MLYFDPPPPSESGHPSIPPPPVLTSPSTSLNVLFVDDERFIRQLMRELLRDVGLRAETAADGYEALRKFRSAHWDIVFTDQAMPGMTGEELAQQIKQMEPEIPVIMVTGCSHLSLNRGVIDAVVEKPFTRDKLCGAIWHALLTKTGHGFHPN
jgi:CheY-like chemotaxis protein